MERDRSLEGVLEGVLFLHSETGTEGGYWAFQDSQHIQEDVPRGYCKNCSTYLKEQSGPLQVQGVIALDEEVMQEYERTGEIKEKLGCDDGRHEEEVGDSWSYEGLHILENGDHLTIYRPNSTKEVWSGMINLKQYDLFTQDAFGLWIHADQIGIERDVWAEYFFKGYRARLLPAEKP